MDGKGSASNAATPAEQPASDVSPAEKTANTASSGPDKAPPVPASNESSNPPPPPVSNTASTDGPGTADVNKKKVQTGVNGQDNTAKSAVTGGKKSPVAALAGGDGWGDRESEDNTGAPPAVAAAAVAAGAGAAPPSASAPPGGAPAPAPGDQPNGGGVAELDDWFRKVAVTDPNERKKHIRVIQSDPNSHLFSAKTFKELNMPEVLLNGVYTMGFDRPSQIQEVALPMILASPPQNLIGQAQSGSGKTAAFCLGMLNRIDTSQRCCQALCVAPTRELASQILQFCVKPMSQHMTDLTTQLAVAGVMIPRGQRCDAHLVVGTPGKIEDWLRRGGLNPRTIKVFVLDEADEMVKLGGHRDKSIAIHRRMPPSCQSLLFSATFSDEIMDFAKHVVRNPNIIKVASDEELILDVIKQLWVRTSDIDGGKIQLLADIYDLLELVQSIIFVQTKMAAMQVTNTLTEKGFDVSTLHGDQDNTERDACMEDFREGRKKVLVTTNVLARGVDVPSVSLVINYDLPVTYQNRADFETYLHRIGRTGRFGRKGCAINFVNDDQDQAILADIERHFSPGREMILQAPGDDVEELERVIKAPW